MIIVACEPFPFPTWQAAGEGKRWVPAADVPPQLASLTGDGLDVRGLSRAATSIWEAHLLGRYGRPCPFPPAS